MLERLYLDLNKLAVIFITIWFHVCHCVPYRLWGGWL